jgi:hypothetical protein
MTYEQAAQKAMATKILIKTGAIEYGHGRDILQECLSIMDEQGKKIAEKYGKRHRPINISAYLR